MDIFETDAAQMVFSAKQDVGAFGTVRPSTLSGTEELVSRWDANSLGPDEGPPFEQAGELHGDVARGWGSGGMCSVARSTRVGVQPVHEVLVQVHLHRIGAVEGDGTPAAATTTLQVCRGRALHSRVQSTKHSHKITSADPLALCWHTSADSSCFGF